MNSRPLNFGSFCSGIGAPECAWSPLGFVPRFFSEIEPFPCAVLAHHYPSVPNLGDMEKISEAEIRRFPVDVCVAGTPCQSFSVAGLRKGMADPRGNLALVFLRLVDWLRPRWVVWENVPGVLSSESGRDFGCFLGALGQLGYGWAYRVLDAQYAGVPQRRRRVFVVGCAGNWSGAAAVLFERHSLSGNPPPCRETKARIASGLTRGADSSSRGGYAGRRREDDYNLVANCLDAHMGMGWPDDNAAQANHLIGCLAANGKAAGSATQQDAEGFDASEDGSGRGTPLIACAAIPILEVGKGSSSRGVGPNGCGIGTAGDPMFTLQAGAQHAIGQPIPIDMRQASRGATMTNNRGDGICSGGAPGTGIGEAGDPSPTVAASHTPAIAFDTTQITSGKNYSNPQPGDPCHPLASGAHAPAVAFQERGRTGGRNIETQADVAYSLNAPTGGGRRQEMNVSAGMAVRRLTPLECERLQGFPDGYSAISFKGKPAADGPRYRALGNSMAVPVLKWIGKRIMEVCDVQSGQI